MERKRWIKYDSNIQASHSTDKERRTRKKWRELRKMGCVIFLHLRLLQDRDREKVAHHLEV